MSDKPLLELQQVSKSYRHSQKNFNAVHQVSLEIYHNEVLGLIGESGSGKSTIAKMIMMLEKPTKGKILFKGQDLFSLKKDQKFSKRRQIQIVFQNPFNALNPRMTLKQVLSEPLDIHSLYLGSKRTARIEELISWVGLENNHLTRYPHQFSGGQLQRICIARALAVEPELLICDEPLSALDLSVTAQIINLLRECQKQFGLAMLFISHDLAAVDMLADRVLVMKTGSIVEEGKTNDVFFNPKHAYTQSLLDNNKCQ